MKLGNTHIFGRDWVVGLALDPDKYRKWHLKMGGDNPSFCRPGSHAVTHPLEMESGSLWHIICMDEPAIASSLEIATLLVHEAVHVFQGICDRVGETDPSAELEAYGIQSISLELMSLYVELKGE